MKCATCRYFQPTEYGNQCRSRSPQVVVVVNGHGESKVLGRWPLVQATDWCGDWDRHEEPKP